MADRSLRPVNGGKKRELTLAKKTRNKEETNGEGRRAWNREQGTVRRRGAPCTGATRRGEITKRVEYTRANGDENLPHVHAREHRRVTGTSGDSPWYLYRGWSVAKMLEPTLSIVKNTPLSSSTCFSPLSLCLSVFLPLPIVFACARFLGPRRRQPRASHTVAHTAARWPEGIYLDGSFRGMLVRTTPAALFVNHFVGAPSEPSVGWN